MREPRQMLGTLLLADNTPRTAGDVADSCNATCEPKQMLGKLPLINMRELELQVAGMVPNRLRLMKKRMTHPFLCTHCLTAVVYNKQNNTTSIPDIARLNKVLRLTDCRPNKINFF